MLRWLGAALILCGGMLTRQTLLDGRRRAQRLRRGLAMAFEAMEAEIRLLLTPMPALLRRGYDGETGVFFTRIAEWMSRGEPLTEAWRSAAEELPLPREERETLAALGARLGAGEESVCAALSLMAATLRKRYEEIEKDRAQEERVITSICVSISLFLAVFLF